MTIAPTISNLAELKHLIDSDLHGLNSAQTDELSWIISETKEFLQDLAGDASAAATQTKEGTQAYADSLLRQAWHSRILADALDEDLIRIADGQRSWTARRSAAMPAWDSCVSYHEFCNAVPEVL